MEGEKGGDVKMSHTFRLSLAPEGSVEVGRQLDEKDVLLRRSVQAIVRPEIDSRIDGAHEETGRGCEREQRL